MLKPLVQKLYGLSPEDARSAASAGNLTRLKKYISLGARDLLYGDDDLAALSPIHLAAARGYMDILNLLLSKKADCNPNCLRNNDFTPLHAAAMKGHAAACQLLLSAGANPNRQTNPQGYTPLHSAAFIGHIPTLTILLAGGADRTIRNYRNELASDTALRQGHREASSAIACGT